MRAVSSKIAFMSAVSVLSLGLGASAASAGAFGLREQSATGQGVSFAGAAAGGAGLGSMFWNPATITNAPGIQLSISGTLIAPYAKLTAEAGSSAGYGRFGSANSGDIGQDAFLPAGYGTYQVNDRIWVGISTNTPFGLTTKADSNWAGIAYGSTTRVASFAATPTVGYKINNVVSVAAGLQIMYFQAKYASGVPNGGAPSTWLISGLEGDSTGVGYTLGATFKPIVGTEIGIGFRSAVEQKLSGNFFGAEAAGPGLRIPAAVAGARFNTPLNLNVILPEMVTVGLRQTVSPQLTLLAGAEWTNWSRLKSPAIIDETTNSNHLLQPYLPLDYKDGWYFSVGAEYAWSPAWTVRAGLGYEISPIKDISRSTRLPDNDRVWASLGLGYKLNEKLTVDLGYTHIFTTDTKITMNSANPNYKASLAAVGLNNLNAKVDSRIDIFSVGLTYRWDDPVKPIPAALSASPVVRKG